MTDFSPHDFSALAGSIGSTFGLLAGQETESQAKITTRKMRADLKHKTISATKKERLAEVMPALPASGECFHIVSNGDFDYWTWVPVMVGYMTRADEFYGSTWTVNRRNVMDLLEMLDDGRIGKASFLTGVYFKRRESAVYATLLQGLARRGMRFACLENHAKVTLLANHEAGTYLVLEGSANYTANPRIEQNIIANDRALYEFHRGWLEECLSHGDA